jgi:hypothetical protein
MQHGQRTIDTVDLKYILPNSVARPIQVLCTCTEFSTQARTQDILLNLVVLRLVRTCMHGVPKYMIVQYLPYLPYPDIRIHGVQLLYERSPDLLM